MAMSQQTTTPAFYSKAYAPATRGRARKRIVERGKMSLEDASRQVSQSDQITRLVLAAGKEALRCSGWGWFPESDISVNQAGEGKPLLLELLGFKRIQVRVNLAPLVQQALSLHENCSKVGPLAIIEDAVWSLVRLFAGHYDECPWDAWRHSQLLDATVWGGFKTYSVGDKEMRIAGSITSFFERSVVTYSITKVEKGDFLRGLGIERHINQHPPHLLSSLHQRMQSLLFPKAAKSASGICCIDPDPLADALVPEVLFILFQARVRSVRGKVKVRGGIRRPTSWQWSRIVEDLADFLAPYLVEQQDADSDPQNPFGPEPGGDTGGGPPLPGGEGDGLDTGPPAGLTGDGTNPFEDLDNPGRIRPSGGDPGGGPLPTRGGGPNRFDNFALIDRYYTDRATALVIEDKTEQGEEKIPELLKIGYLDHEEATLRDLLSGHIDWFRTRVGEPDAEHPHGLRLFRMTDPLKVPAQCDEPVSTGFPHLLLLVDSSSSMRFSPPSPGRPPSGKYDIVLAACWGVFKYIESQSLAGEVKMAAINFSGRSDYSDWHPASAPEKVKRILAVYQGGGTTLNTGVLRKAMAESPGSYLTIAMTDGGLGNTQQALQQLEGTAKAGNTLALFHIGTSNAFTRGVQELGGSVHLLQRAEDLVGLCLDLAREKYRVSA